MPTGTGLGKLAARLNDALPQTQCTRCGYADCAAYARAIADQKAEINQCPPGGAEGIARLAAITGRAVLPLGPEFGEEAPRQRAIIDEDWCIGCTLCIAACPTDAIIGASKWMHTVVDVHCTGCELCLPVCPVDCISLENVSGDATGWSAWSPPLAQTAKGRYATRQQRLSEEKARQNTVMERPTSAPDKDATIAAALARARMQRAP